MPKTQDKKRKQDLGIFYTPLEVVDFIFEVLKIWINREDQETNRWQSHKPFAHYPSVIDPACGEGIFLKKAVESGFTGEDTRYKVPFAWGVDLDATVVSQWEKISILHMFHNNREKMQNHFFHQNGLVPLPKISIIYKKKGDGLKQFDAVVGNPPYGGVGLQEITSELEMALFDFEIWKSATRKQTGKIVDQLGLLGTTLVKKDREKLTSFPIEILFVDRFIQLAKDGGYIAIIIPDGILTNSNADYVRKYVSKKTRIEAIVSLPRNTFKNVGTSAKTSIIFLRKLKPDEKTENDYPVFLSSLESINSCNFQKITEAYQMFYNKRKKDMDKSQLIQITKDQTSKEIVMVRIDKTLKEMMEEKPQSRWDIKYWHPKYEDVINTLQNSKYPIEKVGKYIELITYGSTKPRDYSPEVGQGIKYIRSVNVLFTGLNDADIHWIKEGGRLDGSQYRLKLKDVVMNKCGTGTSGRSFCLLKMDRVVVSQHTMLIRLKNIEPCYFVVFMDSIFGASQFEKYDKGTSGQTHVDFEDIKGIKIPVLPPSIQANIDSEYKKMFVYHNKAMEAKKNGNNEGRRKSLEIAEKMLRDLIQKTEEVIKGERKDVI